MMEYRIGCSGYYYPQWREKLYPKGLAPRNWLSHYSSVFNTVELNGTFYRKPKVTDLKKYFSITPDHFAFSVKMSRYISHVQRLKDKQTIYEFQDLIREGLGSKIQHFLFQMPPTYQYNEENLANLVDSVPNTSENVVEFRHISWWNEEVRRSLSLAGITFCNIDYPRIESWFVQTTDKFYLRLHGNPEVFKTPYSKRQLEHFYDLIPKDPRVCTVYFNNTMTEAGFQNAMQLKDIASKMLLGT